MYLILFLLFLVYFGFCLMGYEMLGRKARLDLQRRRSLKSHISRIVAIIQFWPGVLFPWTNFSQKWIELCETGGMFFIHEGNGLKTQGIYTKSKFLNRCPILSHQSPPLQMRWPTKHVFVQLTRTSTTL